MDTLPLSRAFTLIEPGPVTLITTNDGRKDNIMTITWTMVLDFSASFAITTGPWNHSFAALQETRECVIAIPAADLIDKVVGVGTCTGADTDKFEKFGFTPLKAKHVQAPLIKECLANIECRVVDIVDLAGEPFVALRPNTLLRSQIDLALMRQGGAFRPVMETGSGVTACSMVARGVGVSISDPIVARSFVGHGVVMRPLSSPMKLTYGFLVEPASTINPLIRKMAMCVIEAVEELGGDFVTTAPFLESRAFPFLAGTAGKGRP